MPVISVDAFGFTSDGLFLVTLESHVELNGDRISCLKFWQRERGTSRCVNCSRTVFPERMIYIYF